VGGRITSGPYSLLSSLTYRAGQKELTRSLVFTVPSTSSTFYGSVKWVSHHSPQPSIAPLLV
jgi:hypothetical protein